MERTSRLLTLALLGSMLLADLISALPKKKIRDEAQAEEFMKELDVRYSHECNLEMQARWEYIVDVMDTGKETAANEAAVRYLNFKGDAAVNSSMFEYDTFDSIDLYRKFRFLSKQGPGALDGADLTEYKDRQSQMETIYSTATICDYYEPTRCDLTLEPDIEYIMANSQNWDELRYVWDQWREVSGKLMRENFIRFVELSNKAAVLDGFDDTSKYWLNGYTVDEREAAAYADAQALSQEEFKLMAEDVWDEVSTKLYKKLHSWVRYRMADVYPDHVDLTGPIPANILGNMWAQDWVNIADDVMPFPEFPSYDVTDSMEKNGWDVQQIFESAQDFFESLSLYPMTPLFWEKSVVNQTAWGKVMLCHASAEDFCLGPDGDDYRIKMCTEVNMEDLVTVHHEMGHIEYFMAYKNQPHVFRESANPGFHEAIGDLIALSVSTPSHMEKILHLSPEFKISGGTSRYTDEEKRDLNFLMRMALEKIAFLPFGFLIDNFRWGVFDGSIPEDEMNAGWWELRENLQGVTPPGEPRGEEYFDAGAKYHVPANVPYIRYFVSFIVQFQFHAHLCDVAGHVGPLHTCDIYNNTDAGAVLKNALQGGFSEPWPIVLKDLGGSASMDPQPIISYFQPLIDFLDGELATAGQCIGWGDDCFANDNNETTTESPTPEPTSTESPTIKPTTPEPTSTESPTIKPTTPAPTSTESPTIKPTTSAPASTESPTSKLTTADPGSTVSPTSEFTTNPTTEPPTTIDPSDEEMAKKEMYDMDTQMTLVFQNATSSNWDYVNNPTEKTKNASITTWRQVKKTFSQYYIDVINHFTYDGFEDDDLKRQFALQKDPGVSALNDTALDELTGAVSKMVKSYGTKICPVQNKNCKPNEDGIGIEQVLTILTNSSLSFKDRQYYWEEWRFNSGKEIRDDFKTYVDLENLAANKSGFTNAGLMWLEPYTDVNYTNVDFKTDIQRLWNETKPLYKRLHAYVLHKLRGHYKDIKSDEDLLPVHLVGDMWGEDWSNIYEIVKPYNDPLPDITDDLAENVTEVSDMAAIAEDFFSGIGLFQMTDSFNNNSLFEKEEGDKSICKATVWDFYSTLEGDVDPQVNGDYRIKMCGKKTQEDLLTIHHEMGHVQYMMAYSKNGMEKMPLVFRDGANPAFHEAVSNTIDLSVNTPTYLQRIADRLSNTRETNMDMDDPMNDEMEPMDHNTTINFLLKTALSKVPALPYSYVLDAWRWGIFEDSNHEDFNKQWWTLRIAEQGVAPPVKRLPHTDFDAGSRYDVAVSVPYIWRFVANILQFQFHKHLCDLTGQGQNDTYHECSIDGQEAAGAKLLELMSAGRSVRWPDVLQRFLDDEQMSSDALLEYFAPLDLHLQEYIKEHKLKIDWDESQIDKYMEKEVEQISATVPIVVGIVLAIMVCVVIVAYFVGQKKQSKKRKALKAQGGTNVEMTSPTKADSDTSSDSSSHSSGD